MGTGKKSKRSTKKAGTKKGKRLPIPGRPRKLLKTKLVSSGVRAQKSISLASDGVNTGSVWKNTTVDRMTFPVSREKCADLVSGGSAYQLLNSQYLNPGNTVLFPRFSGIAKNYEMYRVNHLKFFFRTEAYMASGSVVSAGLIGMATSFDPDAAYFTTMSELENYENSISGPPFSGVIVHDVIEARRKRGNRKGGIGDLALNDYFVNYAPNQISPGSTPGKFYDIGELQVASNGTQAGTLGELWVEYSFTMIHPLDPPGAPAGAISHWSSLVPTTSNNLAGMIEQSGSNIAGLLFGTNMITFPPGIAGTYMILGQWNSATSATQSVIAATGSSVALLNFASSGLNSRDAISTIYSGNAATGAQSSMFMKMIRIDNTSSNTLTINTPSVLTGQSAGEIFILAIPTGLSTGHGSTSSTPSYQLLLERLSLLETKLGRGLGQPARLRQPSLNRVFQDESKEDLIDQRPFLQREHFERIASARCDKEHYDKLLHEAESDNESDEDLMSSLILARAKVVDASEEALANAIARLARGKGIDGTGPATLAPRV